MKLGVYVQVPFCQTKCTYCNFRTGVVSSAKFAPYVNALCAEIRGYQRLLKAAGVELPESFGLWGANEAGARTTPQGLKPNEAELFMSELKLRPPKESDCFGESLLVDTVYIGGGTPSLLEPRNLQSVMDAIREAFVTELAEVTLEADPETIEKEKAAAWMRAGINRVSLGAQSFSDKELIAAGRMHRRADIGRAAGILREAGIENISMDLIAGLPHQTKESWQESLEELAALEPEHVSVYLLEIDEGSRLGKEVLKGGEKYSAAALPSEEEVAEFYETAQEFLGRAGYRHYEISNWAKPGWESRHNLKYWRREAYLGFGAGAHSFSGTERWANAHDAAAYVSAVESGRLPVEQLEKVTAEQALEEELFLGLRQLDGIDVSRIERDYKVNLAARFEPLASAGLVEREGSVVRLAPGRLSVSNEVFVELMR